MKLGLRPLSVLCDPVALYLSVAIIGSFPPHSISTEKQRRELTTHVLLLSSFTLLLSMMVLLSLSLLLSFFFILKAKTSTVCLLYDKKQNVSAVFICASCNTLEV
jgi:hypothetical protein